MVGPVRDVDATNNLDIKSMVAISSLLGPTRRYQLSQITSRPYALLVTHQVSKDHGMRIQQRASSGSMKSFQADEIGW